MTKDRRERWRHSQESSSIDCPNARVPMSYAQPLKSRDSLPPWSFRLHRGIRLYNRLSACYGTVIWSLSETVQSRRSDAGPTTSGLRAKQTISETVGTPPKCQKET